MEDNSERQQRYQARQHRLKEKVDARIAAAQDERGLMIVITGDGKGKSTSGFGTVTRAVGHGMNAGVVQFIKGTWNVVNGYYYKKPALNFISWRPVLPGKHKTRKRINWQHKASGRKQSGCWHLIATMSCY